MALQELNKKEMGKRIRERRNLMGMSREALGKSLGVTGKTIANIEYGEKGMTLKNLYLLKQILGISIDFMMEGGAANESVEEHRQEIMDHISGHLSACSNEDLERLEQIIWLYMEGTKKE